jgi:uncharacterized protein (TIGR02271 family)
MPLHKIKDFDPDYRDYFEGQDVIGYDLYAGTDRVGSVDDLLVDDLGKIRYLIINTGLWILGKKVLLPIGQARIDYAGRRTVVNGLTRTQIEALPAYDGNLPVDYEHEEQVRGVYRPTGMGSSEMSTASLESTAPLDAAPVTSYDRDSYTYDRDPGLYDLDETNHQNLRLYEERLIANKTRAKTGEVAIGKRVETETARVAVPIDKERIVIERTTPSATGAAVTPGDMAFREGEVARMEVYEETPDIRKEAFVREEVTVRKQIDHETVNAEETVRREELDVNTEGRPIVDQGTDSRRI